MIANGSIESGGVESLRERIEEPVASLLCRITPGFSGLYLTWGAIQERSTLEAYGVLARRTQNPVLRELLHRIIKDERRHYAFYINRARPHLHSRMAQWLTSTILRHFWTPVGDSVKDDPKLSGPHVLYSATEKAWNPYAVLTRPSREVTGNELVQPCQPLSRSTAAVLKIPSSLFARLFG